MRSFSIVGIVSTNYLLRFAATRNEDGEHNWYDERVLNQRFEGTTLHLITTETDLIEVQIHIIGDVGAWTGHLL